MSITAISVAFLAGLVSFLSPCVLPLIPGFLVYLSGAALADSGVKKIDIFLNSLFFVLGFSALFSLLGVLLNSILSAVAYDALVWLSRIGGVIIIFFGVYLAGWLKVPLLEREYKLTVKKKFKSRYLTSFVFGAAFAVGWTPCVGAVLGSILALAATQPGAALGLLLSYSAGFGLPFLAVGLFTAQASAWINRKAKWLKYVNVIFGLMLIGLGVLVFTRNLGLLANFELLKLIK